MSERAIIALGSNLGDRAAYLATARGALSLLPGTALVAASTVTETIPFGESAQGPYLNQMVAVDTALPPVALLRAMHDVERRLGRVRRERWGARTIDLDLVRYGDQSMQSAELTLPHPGLHDRVFWQRELAELTTVLSARS